MNSLGQFQRSFADAILDASGDAAPSALDEEARRRFRVYRNNVHHGLSAALADAYPIVRQLVGDAFFQAMARSFVLDHPPTSRSLTLYGEGLGDFIDAFPPAATVPYLADVARLERAALEALHSAEAAPLDPISLHALGEAIDDASFVAHPATRIVASEHPILTLWQAQRAGGGPVTIEGRPETVLVSRPHEQVLVRALDPATGAFASALLSGVKPTAALATAMHLDPSFDALTAFQHLLAAGALTAVTPPANLEEARS